MRKTKKWKKTIPLVMIVAVLFSLFSFGVSAMKYGSSGVCVCVLDDYFAIGRDELIAINTDSMCLDVACSTCKTEYAVTFNAETLETILADNGWDEVRLQFYVHSDDTLNMRGLLYFEGEPYNSTTLFHVKSVSVSMSEVVPPEDVEFCDCVWFTSIKLTSSELINLHNHNSPAVIECSSCMTTYAITIVDGWSQVLTTDCEYYEMYLFKDDSDNVKLSIFNGMSDGLQNVSYFDVESVVVTYENGHMLHSMVGSVTTGLGGILKGIGGSVVTFFDNTVLDVNGDLTTFAVWALAFLGIMLAVGIARFITNIVRK